IFDDSRSSLIQFLFTWLYTGNALLNGFEGTCNGFSGKNLPFIHPWQDVVLAHTSFLSIIRKLSRCCNAHVISDGFRLNVENTSENRWEPKAVIHLIWKITSTSCNNPCSSFLGIPRPNLRNRVSASKNYRVIRHGFYPFLLYGVRSWFR